MKGIGAFLEGLKMIKKVQTAMENLGKDHDLDGKPDLINLQEAFQKIGARLKKLLDEAKPLIDDVKEVIDISKRIMEHLDD